MDSEVIREAKQEDIPRIVEIGREFLLSGPYKEIIEDNPEAASQLAERLMSLPESARVLVSYDEGKVTGVLAFIVYPHFYSGVTTGQEICWIVDPAHRQSLDSICLLRAAQRMAREMGAKYMQFSAPEGTNVGKLYELSGYSVIETGYQKRL